MDKTAGMWLSAFIGVAIVAVLVSRNANTAQAIQSLGSALSNILGSVVAPVTGSAQNITTSYPTSGVTPIVPNANAASTATPQAQSN